jgi:hypothetical protein
MARIGMEAVQSARSEWLLIRSGARFSPAGLLWGALTGTTVRFDRKPLPEWSRGPPSNPRSESINKYAPAVAVPLIHLSPLADVEIPEVPVTELVLRHAIDLSDKPALIDGSTGRALTFGALAATVRSLAGGWRPGDSAGARCSR